MFDFTGKGVRLLLSGKLTACALIFELDFAPDCLFGFKASDEVLAVSYGLPEALACSNYLLSLSRFELIGDAFPFLLPPMIIC